MDCRSLVKEGNAKTQFNKIILSPSTISYYHIIAEIFEGINFREK